MNVNRNNGEVLNEAVYAQGTMDNNVRLADVQNMFRAEINSLQKELERVYPANSAIHNSLVNDAQMLFKDEMSALRTQINECGSITAKENNNALNKADLMLRGELKALREEIAQINNDAHHANANSLCKLQLGIGVEVQSIKSHINDVVNTSNNEVLNTLDNAQTLFSTDVADLKEHINESMKMQSVCRTDINSLRDAIRLSASRYDSFTNEIKVLRNDIAAQRESFNEQQCHFLDRISKVKDTLKSDISNLYHKHTLIQQAIDAVSKATESNRYILKTVSESQDKKLNKLIDYNNTSWWHRFKKWIKGA